MLPRLLGACGPVPPAVIRDPDPDGGPSPLRTAKEAWSDIDPDSTHHIVLQDDVLPCTDFGGVIGGIIKAAPESAIALYVNWNTPINSHLVRLAAVTGSPFAVLSPEEWVPTLALILPTPAARDLGAYLRRFPDSYRHDDQLVASFVRDRRLRLLATVPSLVQHVGDESVAGNQHNGIRRAAVPPHDIAWTAPSIPAHQHILRRLAAKAAPASGRTVVGFRRSHCYVRLVPRGLEEHVECRYPWDWQDVAPGLGWDAARIRSGCEDYLAGSADTAPDAWSGLSASTILDFWAACYLLGLDASGITMNGALGAGHEQHPVIKQAIASWAASGLAATDLACADDRVWDLLAGLGLAAISRAQAGDGGAREPAAGKTEPPGARLPPVFRRMAIREAICMRAIPASIGASDDADLGEITFVPVTCPCCGAGKNELAEYVETLPFYRNVRIRAAARPEHDAMTLRLLGCERIAPRKFLFLIWLRERAGTEPLSVQTRAACASSRSCLPVAMAQSRDALDALDRGERWIYDVQAGKTAPGGSRIGLTLPFSSIAGPWSGRHDVAVDLRRRGLLGPRWPQAVTAHPISHHLCSDEWYAIARGYRQTLAHHTGRVIQEA